MEESDFSLRLFASCHLNDVFEVGRWHLMKSDRWWHVQGRVAIQQLLVMLRRDLHE